MSKLSVDTCDSLGENTVHPTNVEFVFEGILFVQMVFKLKSN